MRIGRIGTYTDEGFAKVKAQSLSFLEICCNSEAEAWNLIQEKANVYRRSHQYGIDISSVGRWNHDILQNGQIDQERYRSYTALLDAAVELGARTFVCGVNYDESISLYKNYTHAIRFLGDLLAYANGRIRVAVQNCSWNNFILGPQQWDILFSELSDLCIKHDPSHAYNRGADYLRELSDYGERIAHVHIKGVIQSKGRKIDDPPAGMDDIRWPSVFGILYARGYDGDLSIEPHSATWQGELGDFGVDFTHQYIRNFVKK